MEKQEDTIIVFTARSPERIIREGGSQAWKVAPAHARQMTYVVCTQNQHHPDHNFSDATEPHGSGFLVGRGLAVYRAPNEDDPDRYMLGFSEYARINVPHLWKGRLPFRYTSLEALGINPDNLDWQPMPQNGKEPPTEQPQPASSSAPLTIQEAKRQLAATFGVKPEAIEITIHG